MDMPNLLEEMEPLAVPMRTQVMDELGKRVAPLVTSSWDELQQQILRLDAVLQEANGWRAKDPPGAVHVKVACTVLAIYRTLLPCFEDKQVLLDQMKAVIHAINFQGGMDAFLLDHFGISPEAPEDAWNRICANFIPKGRERYGSAWVVEQGIKDQRRCFFNFRKCGFADFFLDNDAREVLYLLCATDYIWGDALEKKYGIRFERPTILAEGADACRFQLFKMTE
jgi:hypothetical protein